MELIIFVGPQGAGKSTFYQSRFADTHIRINRDMLKTRHRESLLFQACLEMKQSCVLDRTNPTIKERAPFIQTAKAQHFRVQAYHFVTSYDAALQRNNQREGKARVPEVGLKSVFKQLCPPTRMEGFDAVFEVRCLPAGQFDVVRVDDAI
ncbi:ATP-binding protein [Jeongeupia sp. USM3]|uniref:ATP-binding protein n=1 Tax=Jeongeupia sp. USM3 TaxID=1906741 RepID=UPI00089DECFD|nr:ATP-binding protein [Jeongeupia sp. USM3]AOY01430.1 kinase [Jeongeupia sp. USM3]